MTLLKPTLIIFDMDGTTVRHINPKLLHVLEKLDDTLFWFTTRLHREKEEDPQPTHKKPRPRLLVHRALHKFRNKDVAQIVEPCPGIRDCLKLIQSLNIPMAIVSNGLGKGYGHDILQKFDLEKFFKAQIFREDFSRAKPDPEPLMNAIAAMNVTISENDVIWCIGDRRKDIIAALALQDELKCKVEPLSYGLDAAIAILKNALGTDHILTTYQDLEMKLKDLYKNG